MSKYTTFSQLVIYARARAVKSAARNGHQEFAYWIKTAAWASLHADDPRFDDQWMLMYFYYYRDEVRRACDNGDYIKAAEQYARAVHIRKMLAARGCPPARLSLDWLRNAANEIETEK